MSKQNRANWSNWFEFAFSCIGSMVGLGNVWRFPYICFKNGGGAFLIPYLIFMLTMAVPLMFVEFSLGQFSSLGPAKVWMCCPLFKGLGYAMIVVAVMTNSYYSSIISWTLFYFGNSFLSPLPWSSCNNKWNTKTCYFRAYSAEAGGSNMTIPNITEFQLNITLKTQTSSEEFWEHRVLGLTDSIHHLGNLRWELVLCSLSTWIVVFIVLIKGIKTSGKFMYFAATLPYLFLTILLIRGSLLPGAADGIKYFFIPRWKDLLKFSVWSDAAVQVFYSTSLGIGELLTLASHNQFRNNCHRDALILPFVDAFTSIFAGCVVFATIGYTAAVANVDMHSVVKQGPGIAFMVYPDALSTLPLPQLWSALFFLLLFMIGVNSLVVVIHVISGGIFDNFPNLALTKKTLITLSLCLFGFLTSLLYLTGGGMYVLQLVDWYIASIPRMFLVVVEITAISYVYGASNLLENIAIMIGYPPPKIWKYIWFFVTPPLTAFVWLFMTIQHESVKYGDVAYPSWCVGIGWIIAAAPFSALLLGMVHTVWTLKGSFCQRLKSSVKPAYAWKQIALAESELKPTFSEYKNENDMPDSL